jgi:hypothetical protein
VAEEGDDEVLQLEEGTREVRDHLAEEKVAHGLSSPWGATQNAAISEGFPAMALGEGW